MKPCISYDDFAERYDVKLEAQAVRERPDILDCFSNLASHWHCKLTIGGRLAWDGYYSKGSGHARAWMNEAPRFNFGDRGRIPEKPMQRLSHNEKILPEACWHYAEKNPPDISEVLESLQADTASADQDFGDWARDYGYNDDSIKAKAIWETCNKTRRGLQAVMSQDVWDTFTNCQDESDEPTIDELHQRFDDEILPLVVEQYSADDVPAKSEAFNDWIDSLERDDEITRWLADNIEHPKSCD